jgi:uncharacterized protein
MLDFHTHPLLVREMYAEYPDLARVAREVFHIGNNPQPLETFLLELDVAGLAQAVLLPIDARTTRGCQIYSNEQIARLCKMSERFIGFASVDPHRREAVDDLHRAVGDLNLKGLKLSPPTQEFQPDDLTLMAPIYAAAVEAGLPVIFHAGMSWEPRARMSYGDPLRLEAVACEFPSLNIVIAHFAWPWVAEAAALALKYPNVFIDTSCLYFDNPRDFLGFVMTKQIPLTLIERGLRHKIIFGSNYPRVELKNMAAAVRSLPLSAECLHLIFEGNARRLLGEAVR